jgi:hypothetical protein
MAERIGWGWSKNRGAYLSNLWQTYRLKADGFEKFWAEQDGKCAGCAAEFAHPHRKEMRLGVKPQVDHEHRYDAAGLELQCEAEDVRGLLCSDCNNLLRKVRDQAITLRRLSAYLQAHGSSLL